MIEFYIQIQQDAAGRVRLTCVTPPGKASMREMDVARELQAAVQKISSPTGKFKTTVTHPWSGANNPARQ